MGISFEDLDVNLQRSVWSAVTILGVVLCICLVKFLHYAFIGLCFLASVYLGYVLFVKPKLHKGVKKRVKG